MGMDNELVRFISWERLAGQGRRQLDCCYYHENWRHWGDTPREKRKSHCGCPLLTLQSWLAISSLGFHANGILVSLSAGAQQRHKMFKITIYFCGNVEPSRVEYSGFPCRVRTLNLEKTWEFLVPAHATIKQTEVGWGASVSISYLDAPYR